LRARCPQCRTLTAVAVDEGYECHSCGATFPAGLVRVPRAWGAGGETMAASARRPFPYPDTGAVEEATLEAQTETLAASLPARPLVLGGCCCAHAGAIRGLARRGRLAVVWLDAHGDLNTPETSPSGDAWGMPLRTAIDAGDVRAEDVALVGARSLDPGETAFLAATRIDDDVGRALAGAEAVYVALDVDVLEPAAAAVFFPEPGGPGVEVVERLLAEVRTTLPLAGMGLTGHVPETDTALLARLAAAAGLRAVAAVRD
jgi:arginase